MSAVSFDCFGTLVTADRPTDPAGAIASEFRDRGVEEPDDWESLYATPHVELDAGRELPLPEHVLAAIESRGGSPDPGVVEDAVFAAFDRPISVCEGAREAVDRAAETGPVGVLSNCSVPGLVERSLSRAGLADRLDAVVTSVDLGYRKPHPRTFEAVADALGVAPEELCHVGDDPDTDGGIEAVGGRAVILGDRPLAECRFGGESCP